MNLPNVGDRISYSGHLGTIKFIGNVDNTPGTWLGVEWDEPERGKHDGVKDGKRYFSCRIPNAGSFIRPSVNVIRGVSFLAALQSKYIEAFHGTSSQEKVTLGSSNGVIEVEAVNLDKIRGKFANLERLREVSLENELVARADTPGLIMETCPNIRGLNLSTSLLPSWLTVADIAVELPALQTLSLNRNRLQIPPNPGKMTSAFLGVTSLELNGTLTTWQEMQYIVSFMPKLLAVELGYNNISRMADNEHSTSPKCHITALNLDSNYIKDWKDLSCALSHYHHLERLVLTSNKIESIPSLEEHPPLGGLKYLSLTSNLLRQWKDIDTLALWCPALISLSLNGNPMTQHDWSDEARHARAFTIARIPSLKILDSTTITSKERTDCELFYLSWISQHFTFDGDPESVAYKTALIREHPRWEELCKRHGTPTTTNLRSSDRQDNLSSKLIEIQILLVLGSSPSKDDIGEMVITRILPTMTLKMLRAKTRKQLKCSKNANISLWLKMNDGSWNKLDTERDQQEVDWLGLENGSQLACCIH